MQPDLDDGSCIAARRSRFRRRSLGGVLKPRAHFFGDSFTAGEGDPEGLGWVGRLAAELPQIEFAQHGVPGAPGSYVVQTWLECELDPRRRELAVFCFGANDAVLGVPLEDSLADLERALDRAEELLVPVFVIGPPPVGGPEDAALVRLSSSIEALTTKRGVPFVATHDALGPGSIWSEEARAADGTHPSAGGYAELAQLLRGAGLPAWLLANSSR